MKNISFLLICILLGTFIATSCGENPQRKGPKETAEAFLAALQNNDYEAAKDFCTDGTRNSLSMFETFAGFGANPFSGEFTILREEISDEYARVFYTQGDDDKEKFVRLRKEDGRWEVIANKADFSPPKDEDEDDGSDTSFDSTEDDEGDKEQRHANKFKAIRQGKTPEQIADEFLTAMMFGDHEKAKKLASKDSEMAISMQKDNGKKSMEGFTIVRTKEKDEYATVYYTEKGEATEKELNLKKDPNGNWEVVMTKGDNSLESE